MTHFRFIAFASILAISMACETNQVKDYTADYQEEEPDSIYAEHVRSSSFQSPEEEMASFELPPGFEITLFASEPDISKPINMAFDDRGRLWVTQSSEYPIKAGSGEGKDRISILEDTNRDGKADLITHFAEDLNIPIGIIPVKDGAIGYSIPNLFRFYDQDGDGVADRREVLIADFEHKDTHGMVNNLFRGLDGWIHASHGFSNVSVVAGSDGDSVKMTSGNTFRFRQDGSRVEKTTDGRINPFGSDLDKWGYHYSADCHTLPIYQLIWGGNYTQWGKKEPNLGFAPSMMDYGLNSTALSGLVYYTDDQFPEAFQNSFYSGDVVTCRISRSVMDFEGTTPKARRKVDFLVSKDPWFRPVDIKIGPDGAMYVADFYNKIIGHYEVPLDHPERDRESGRIWKITYKGNERKPKDWSKADLNEILDGMGSSILHTRMSATDALVDYHGNKASNRLRSMIETEETSEEQFIQAIWALFRINELDEQQVLLALSHESPLVKVHTLTALANHTELNENQHQWGIAALDDKNPHVQRAAAALLSRHPHPGGYKKLMELYERTPEYDSHLRYTAKLALFHHLSKEEILEMAVNQSWENKDISLLNLALSDIEHPLASEFLFQQLKKEEVSPEQQLVYLSSVSRGISEQKLEELIDFAKEHFSTEHEWIIAIEEGLNQRGQEIPRSLNLWGEKVSRDILKEAPAKDLNWTDHTKQKYQFALQKARKNRLKDTDSSYKTLLSLNSADEETKAMAAGNLMASDADAHSSYIIELINNPNVEVSLKQKIIQSLGANAHPATQRVLVESIKGSPISLQENIASQLVQTKEGVQLVLENIREGNAPARILKARNVEDTFLKIANTTQKNEFHRLTANLLPVSKEKEALVKSRTSDFKRMEDGLVSGAQLYEKNCQSCHQIANRGGMIGPQLDGIGNWGIDALATKILDPNRNISENFRMYNISLKNGEKVSGLFRREEGQQLVLANQNGEEFKLNKAEIEDQTPVKVTLMPDNFGQTLDQNDFNHLMSYLLNVR
ncbi:PVC-type heme-binding CxxCH protein [Pleomorphovibrio marinus]|uniref:PVC-type heme-binding CxxCH protein n=1 Tax=Pleomorphovibrio marinus TaxID=2164132 RepID=UPI000E0B6023|nr:PVC-type heme-binding CxxCH protein [Pleomorphovibrio marinus]